MRDLEIFCVLSDIKYVCSNDSKLTILFRQDNPKESRVLKPLKPTTMISECNISKASESKCETDGELSESKTLAALEMLKEDDMEANWSTFSKCIVYSLKIFFNGSIKLDSGERIVTIIVQMIYLIINKWF